MHRFSQSSVMGFPVISFFVSAWSSCWSTRSSNFHSADLVVRRDAFPMSIASPMVYSCGHLLSSLFASSNPAFNVKLVLVSSIVSSPSASNEHHEPSTHTLNNCNPSDGHDVTNLHQGQPVHHKFCILTIDTCNADYSNDLTNVQHKQLVHR